MFHVELKIGSFRSSRLFNLEECELVTGVVGPWRARATVDIEGKPWPLADAAITIIEGPRLEPSQLSMGRGWSEAARRGSDVTRRWLTQEPPPAAAAAASGDRRSVVVVHGGSDDETRREVFRRLGGLGLAPLDWELLLTGARDAGGGLSDVVSQAFRVGQAVVGIVGAADGGSPEGRTALVAVGMALASQPQRTVVVAVDEPGDLVRAVRLDGVSSDELAQRLAAAGCTVA